MRHRLPLFTLAILFMFAPTALGQILTTIITTPTTINSTNWSLYHDKRIVVQGCEVTIEGKHHFHSLTIERNASDQPGVVTHPAGYSYSSPSGTKYGFELVLTDYLIIQGPQGSKGGSKIDVSGKGALNGTGGPSSWKAGAGYGGSGGKDSSGSLGGPCYDSIAGSDELGSSPVNTGGRGGGVCIINFHKAATPNCKIEVNGEILANGLDGTGDGGGGSGGAITLGLNWPTAYLEGTGIISANGGKGGNPTVSGGGGGGRIAIYTEIDNFSGTGTIEAYGGEGFEYGGAGTEFLWAKQSSLVPDVMVDNGGKGGAPTQLRPSFFTFAPNFTVTNQSTIHVFKSPQSPFNPVVLRSLSVLNGSLLSHDAGQNVFAVRVIENANIDATSRVDTDLRGHGEGSGPGASSSTSIGSGGAGHGGMGGQTYNPEQPGGVCYGDLMQPVDFGSGAGGLGSSNIGGKGGGSIELKVGGVFTINGVITANGGDGTGNAGGGSGGSINLAAGTLQGTGSITANGGNTVTVVHGGGGGGGRIAVEYTADNFAGKIEAFGGSGHIFQNRYGGAGTIFKKDVNRSSGRLIVDNNNHASWPTQLKAAFWPQASPFDLTVKNGGLVHPYYWLTLESFEVQDGGMISHDAEDNLLNLTVNKDARVEAGGEINVDGKGHATGNGLGASPSDQTIYASGGAGYGGKGGTSFGDPPPYPPNAPPGQGGIPYGDVSEPIFIGSGAGQAFKRLNDGIGGPGGGCVRLEVKGTLTVDGKICANGGAGMRYGGGGSGGGIYLITDRTAGNGTISADGGKSPIYGGGGGGGRITLYRQSSSGTLKTSTKGGTGTNPGDAGTIQIGSGTPPERNLIQNGDFESLHTGPWIVKQYSGTTTITKADMAGCGPSHALDIHDKNINGWGTLATLSQSVSLQSGQPYLLETQFMNSGGWNSSDYSKFTLKVGSIYSKAVTFYTYNTRRRHFFCEVITPTSTGSHPVELDIYVKSYKGGPVYSYIDNVRLIPTTYPVVAVHEERIIGSAVNFNITGTPNAAFYVFLNLNKLPEGVTIPGIDGVMWLSPAYMAIPFAGTLDGNGKKTINFTFPNVPALKGTDLYFQGFESASSPLHFSIGPLHYYPIAR